MKSTILTIITIVLFILPVRAQIHIVVADVNNASDVFHLDGWERSVPEMIRSELSRLPDFVVLEREKLGAIFEEHKLALAGFSDSSAVKQVGELMGAEFILNGTIHKIDRRYRIDINIIRVKTGQIKTEKVEAPDANHLNEMVALLVHNIHHHLTGQGTYKEKVSIARHPTKYFLAAAAGFAILGVVSNNSYLDNKDKYDQASKLEDFDTYYDKANNARKLSIAAYALGGAALIGTLYCWIRNMATEDITAHREPNIQINPNIGFRNDREVTLGVQIRF